MDTYEKDTYLTTIDKLEETLKEYGVAIIPNVYTNNECDELLSSMWDFFEHITQSWDKPINRNDANTYRQFYELFPLHSMLVQYFSVGHSECVWKARQNINAINIFAKLWNVKPEDLLVSFDGISLHLPPEITNKGFFKSPKFHTDQSYTRNDFDCVQSFVSINDINRGDATFAFMEKSNKYHLDCANHFNITDKSDWYVLNDNEKDFYTLKGCVYKRIMCNKGSMVFWDSRTIHCGVEALKERPKPNTRAVIYLCYMPRNKSTQAQLKKKQLCFDTLRTTNHYPHKIKMFPKEPRTYGKTIKNITQIHKPELTELGLKLAGF